MSQTCDIRLGSVTEDEKRIDIFFWGSIIFWWDGQSKVNVSIDPSTVYNLYYNFVGDNVFFSLENVLIAMMFE